MVIINGSLDSTQNVTTILDHNKAQINLNAPKEVGGPGTDFSPTDLIGAALGACIVVTIQLFCLKNNIDFTKAEFRAEKSMAITKPRRISKIIVDVNIQTNCSDEDFQKIQAAGESCPVKHSLHTEVQVIERYHRV
jgi:putative redox protein